MLTTERKKCSPNVISIRVDGETFASINRATKDIGLPRSVLVRLSINAFLDDVNKNGLILPRVNQRAKK